MPHSLAPCPDSPNCVSSLAAPEDHVHAIAPLPFAGDAADALRVAHELLESWPRTRIVEAGDGYLHATCRSRIFGWVDDLELLAYPGAGVLHVRSASRVGYSDLGANRRRVERLRTELGAADPRFRPPHT